MRMLSLAMLLLAACGPNVVYSSDYELELTLTTAPGLTLQGDWDLTLDISGESIPTVVTDGYWEITELPPIEGDPIGLSFADGGTEVAAGQSRPLDLDTGPLDLAVFVAPVDQLSAIGTPENGAEPAQPAAVTWHDGSVWVFGGAAGSDVTSAGLDQVLRMAPLSEGTYAWETQGQLPAALPDESKVGMAAVVLQRGVVLTGGRAAWQPASPSAGLVAIEPTTGETLWSGSLQRARSEHAMVATGPNTTLVFGGYDGLVAGASSQVEVLDLANQQVSLGDTLPVPGVGSAHAALDSSDILVCGGAPSSGATATPSAACARVQPDGSVQTAQSLPQPAARLAMATLADGTVLATGGVTSVIPVPGTAPALTAAWRYFPTTNTWETVGNMTTARAHHRIFPSPSGGAWILGGANAGGLLPLAGVGTDAPCADIYDPDTRQFTQDCTISVRGVDPIVAAHPQIGAVVRSGYGSVMGGPAVFWALGR